MAPRSPQLHHALRAFTLGAFAYLLRELDDAAASLPFAFEEHDRRGGPALYEYRPLVAVVRRGARRSPSWPRGRAASRSRSSAASRRLRSSPAPTPDAIPPTTTRSSAPSCSTCSSRVAEACGGFDWDDECLRPRLRRARALALRRAPHVHRGRAARRPLGGDAARACATAMRVRAGRRRRARAALARGQGLLPPGFGREPDRYCVRRATALGLDAGEDVPDAPAEIADAVSRAPARDRGAARGRARCSSRRSTAGRTGFGRCCRSPRPAARRADAARRVPRRASRRELLVRLGLADADTALAEALDRWELSLFQHEPFRSEQLRAALEALLGDDVAAAAVGAARDRAARLAPTLHRRADARSPTASLPPSRRPRPCGARSSRRSRTASGTRCSRGLDARAARRRPADAIRARRSAPHAEPRRRAPTLAVSRRC